MALRLQTLRLIISCFIVFLSATSLFLFVFLSPEASQRGIVGFLISFYSVNLARCFWSITRKPLFKYPQSVGSEVVSLFILLPFQLIVSLIVPIISFTKVEVHTEIIIFKVCVFLGTSIHMIYTATLIIFVILTLATYDRDVWARDIDSSPSPFSIPILFACLFPLLSTRFSATRPLIQQECSQSTSSFCLPHCNCSNKTVGSPPAIHVRSSGAGNDATDNSGSLGPSSLVRIPNAAERRTSIIVSFDVV